MLTCPHCGSQNPDYYTQCPNCGSALSAAQQQAAAPVSYSAPSYQPIEPVTTTGGWVGWYMLMSLLPIIGTIIMLCSTKDPSAKNYAKLMLILQIIAIVLYIIMFIGMAASGAFDSTYY